LILGFIASFGVKAEIAEKANENMLLSPTTQPKHRTVTDFAMGAVGILYQGFYW